MKPETLRRIIERIEKSLHPVSVYTDGNGGVWCDTYPITYMQSVDLIGVYSAAVDGYNREDMQRWIIEDYIATVNDT